MRVSLSHAELIFSRKPETEGSEDAGSVGLFSAFHLRHSEFASPNHLSVLVLFLKVLSKLLVVSRAFNSFFDECGVLFVECDGSLLLLSRSFLTGRARLCRFLFRFSFSSNLVKLMAAGEFPYYSWRHISVLILMLASAGERELPG